ncbi:MAG: hypothetical protein ACSHX5_02470 [Phycisphaerales bacterium]
MKRNLSSRLNTIEHAVRAMWGCRHCRERGGQVFLFQGDPLPEPCELCGELPLVTRFVVVDTQQPEKSSEPP